MEYSSTENLSTNLRGWKMQVSKTQTLYKSAVVEIVSMETESDLDADMTDKLYYI